MSDTEYDENGAAEEFVELDLDKTLTWTGNAVIVQRGTVFRMPLLVPYPSVLAIQFEVEGGYDIEFSLTFKDDHEQDSSVLVEPVRVSDREGQLDIDTTGVCEIIWSAARRRLPPPAAFPPAPNSDSRCSTSGRGARPPSAPPERSSRAERPRRRLAGPTSTPGSRARPSPTSFRRAGWRGPVPERRGGGRAGGEGAGHRRRGHPALRLTPALLDAQLAPKLDVRWRKRQLAALTAATDFRMLAAVEMAEKVEEDLRSLKTRTADLQQSASGAKERTASAHAKHERYLSHVRRLEEEVAAAKQHADAAAQELKAAHAAEAAAHRSLVALQRVRQIDDGLTPVLSQTLEHCDEQLAALYGAYAGSLYAPEEGEEAAAEESGGVLLDRAEFLHFLQDFELLGRGTPPQLLCGVFSGCPPPAASAAPPHPPHPPTTPRLARAGARSS